MSGAHVDAGRHLRQLDAVRGQPEHRALGDVDDLLAAPHRFRAAERDAADCVDQLADLAVASIASLPSSSERRVPLASKLPQNTTFRAPWEMSMKPPGPLIWPPKCETLTLPFAVDLGEAEKGLVENAAAIEVELLARRTGSPRVGGDAEQVAGQKLAAVDALLDREPVAPAVRRCGR